MNWKDAWQRWQRWNRARRSQSDTLSWLQRSPDELTVPAEREPSSPQLPIAGAQPVTPAGAISPQRDPHPSSSFQPAAKPAAGPAPMQTGEMTLIEVSTEPGRRVVAALVAIEGELEGEVFSVREGVALLGRSSRSDIVLSSRWISREHARIDGSRDAIVLTAVSDKKTLVNGEPLAPAEHGIALKDGDRIQLGRTTLQLRTVE